MVRNVVLRKEIEVEVEGLYRRKVMEKVIGGLKMEKGTKGKVRDGVMKIQKVELRWCWS